MLLFKQLYYIAVLGTIAWHLLTAIMDNKSWKEILFWGILYFGWFIL